MITLKRLMAFDLLLLLAKYSSKENSQVVASKERWPGDLQSETLKSLARVLFFHLFQVFKSIMLTDD